MNLLEAYEETIQRLDKQVQELAGEYQDYIQCQKGCSSCCLDGFKIRYAEGIYLLHAITKMPPETIEKIHQRLLNPAAENKKQCPLLIDGACSMYDARPALCRAYGTMVKVNDEVSTCPLNFQERPADNRIKVLDLEAYYEVLDDLSQKFWEQGGIPGLGEGPNAPRFTIRALLEKLLNVAQTIEQTPVV